MSKKPVIPHRTGGNIGKNLPKETIELFEKELEMESTSSCNENNKGYQCDICSKYESEVGDLRSGRTSTGRDFQICKGCGEKHNFKTLKDVEDYYKMRENINA